MTVQRTGGFCLNWVNRYDTWTAGDCPGSGTGGGLLAPVAAPAPPQYGDADVVGPIQPAAEPRPGPLSLLGG
jgi:hypothetical protein